MTNDDGRKLFIAFYMMPRWNGTNYSLNIILTRIRFSVVYGVCEPYPCLALPPPRSKCGSPLTKNCQDWKSIPKIKVLDSRKSRKILDLPAAVRPPWDFVPPWACTALMWTQFNSKILFMVYKMQLARTRYTRAHTHVHSSSQIECKRY